MLKFSLITDEASQNLQEAVALAKKYNLDAIEIRSVNEHNPFELTDSDVAEIKRISEAEGLPVCCISSPFFKCSLDIPAEIAEHIAALKRCISYAKVLNCGLIRGFTFWETENFEERLNDICEKFSEPIALLAQAGITMVLEFDPSTNATNGRKLATVVERLNTPHIKILWDPGNDIYDPYGECPYPDGYNAVKGSIAHIHLKDAVRNGATAYGAAMCHGDVDYVNQFKRLIQDDYSGYLSLETHYRQKAVLTESQLKMPKGSAFSDFGYESSEECLKNIAELMRSLAHKEI